ncbi:hypothetical protein [Brucella intermedia]|uniref:hypothetical protein n=1 Tax=Brucella intermedia TaxID=94625 RepID=UPI00244EC9CB|nr:hypothetical protein [Brucella intermedia]WGJ07511.1 hypothetical protein QBQ48_04435 [Brucella intermedia]
MEDFENKTERVQLLMTPSEVKAIDDWGFENRIRTRAEAIRRLCRIGLVHDHQTIKLLDPITNIRTAVSEFKRSHDDADTRRFADEIDAALANLFGRLVILALGNDSFKEAKTEVALEATYQRLINHMPEMEGVFRKAIDDAVAKAKAEASEKHDDN